MRKWMVGAVVGCAVTGLALAQETTLPKATVPAPTAGGGGDDSKPVASYGIGLGLGRQLKSQALDAESVDVDKLVQGLRDALGTGKPAYTEPQLQEALKSYQQTIIAKQKKLVEAAKAKADAEGEKAKKEGPAYLAANAKKAGVKVLPSGLQYKVLKEGNGPTPKATDVVTTHYKGTLLDGTEFDSSYKRNEPAQFPVNQVIKGWTEALQLMKVGSKWQLVVPAELAYGATPPPGAPIPPNAVLVFEVELLGIEKPDAVPSPGQ